MAQKNNKPINLFIFNLNIVGEVKCPLNIVGLDSFAQQFEITYMHYTARRL